MINITDWDETIVDLARDYAISCHWGQLYGNHPYLRHLDDVAETVESNFYLKETEENYVSELSQAKVVAYLHDVVEDTEATVGNVVSLCGPRIGAAVFAISKSVSVGSDSSYLKRVTANDLAALVKIADRIANIQFSIDTIDDSEEKLKKYLAGDKYFSEILSEYSGIYPQLATRYKIALNDAKIALGQLLSGQDEGLDSSCEDFCLDNI